MAEHLNTDIAAQMRERYQEIPPKLAQALGIPHPPQERYTREEIRAMIDAALPQIHETQAARARDLSAERDKHGYGY
jgi:hypothetical protein